jgi:CO/xanthine dehydrogenase Mo-binding subunit
MTYVPQINRRAFVASAAALGGGFALGMELPFSPNVVRAAEGAPEVTAWVVIKPDDSVVIRIARSEMGQGSMTGLAQLVAEELECDWLKVSTEFPTPGQNLARNRVWGSQGVMVWLRKKTTRCSSQAASISLNVSSSKIPRSTLAISAPSAPAIGLTSIRRWDATVLRLSSSTAQRSSRPGRARSSLPSPPHEISGASNCCRPQRRCRLMPTPSLS